jgi:CRP/FNR family cyclic AMP-dependent transcriptional regulator
MMVHSCKTLFTHHGCPCTRPCDQAEENATLMSYGQEFRFAKGETLWNHEDSADYLVSVCTGVLKLHRPWSGGREVIIDLVHRGQIAGETAGIPDGYRLSTCTAHTSGRAICLTRERLQAALIDHPELSANLLKVACDRVGAVTTRLETLARGSVVSRLVPIRLSRADLSDMVGCRAESVTRVVSAWERDGVMETLREGFVLTNTAKLGDLALSV